MALVIPGGFGRFCLRLAARQFQFPGKLGGLVAFRGKGLGQLVDLFLLLVRQGDVILLSLAMTLTICFSAGVSLMASSLSIREAISEVSAFSWSRRL